MFYVTQGSYAYGVVLWEIFTRKIPAENLPNDTAIANITKGMVNDKNVMIALSSENILTNSQIAF